MLGNHTSSRPTASIAAHAISGVALRFLVIRAFPSAMPPGRAGGEGRRGRQTATTSTNPPRAAKSSGFRV
jgi:hypothetical protein